MPSTSSTSWLFVQNFGNLINWKDFSWGKQGVFIYDDMGSPLVKKSLHSQESIWYNTVWNFHSVRRYAKQSYYVMRTFILLYVEGV